MSRSLPAGEALAAAWLRGSAWLSLGALVLGALAGWPTASGWAIGCLLAAPWVALATLAVSTASRGNRCEAVLAALVLGAGVVAAWWAVSW